MAKIYKYKDFKLLFTYIFSLRFQILAEIKSNNYYKLVENIPPAYLSIL